ncbi:MAG: sulfide dehydrogenase [Parvularcula sp.]|nr:sulfide dehydrogenase [Parvularcula sp.]
MRFIKGILRSTFVAVFFGLSAAAVAAEGGDPELGRELFQAWSCGGCHMLADAGAMGQIGPSLDGNPNLSYDSLVNSIAYGGGAMPAFGGQLTDEEIAGLAAYILEVAE